jgi:hypothetical protein
VSAAARSCEKMAGGRGIICSGEGRAVKVSESFSTLCMHGRLDVRFETLAKSKTVVLTSD